MRLSAILLLVVAVVCAAVGWHPLEGRVPWSAGDAAGDMSAPVASAAAVESGIGVQMHSLRADRGLGRAQSGGVRWARVLIPWSAIESSPGNYNWEVLDQRMADAQLSGVSIIGVLVLIPEWAGEKENGYVVRVAPSKMGAYQNFLKAVAQRNKDRGYGIVYWEIFNEPDNQDPAYAEYISCAYGAKASMYADLLKASRQALTSVDPNAKVAFGGLALENWTLSNGTLRFNPNFLDAVLSVIRTRGSNGSDYFDVMNIHIYPYYYVTRWSTPSVPGLVGKVQHVRQIMQSRGIVDRPVIVTETGMHVGQTYPTTAQQASYAVRMYTEGVVARAPIVLWFTFTDNEAVPHEPSGLLDRNYQPRPAYWATRYLAKRLEGASYLGTTSGFEVLSGRARSYTFRQSDGSFHLMWGEWTDYGRQTGPLGGTATVRVPGNYARVLNMYGGSARTVVGVGGKVTLALTFEPIYVEIYDGQPPEPTPVVWTPTEVSVERGVATRLVANGGLVEVDIPANALPSGVTSATFRFSPSSAAAPALAAGERALVPPFRLELVSSTTGASIAQLGAALSVRVYYPDEAANGVFKLTGRLQRRAEGQSDWTSNGLSNQRSDMYGNEISSSVTLLGDFIVIAGPGERIYLPTVRRP